MNMDVLGNILLAAAVAGITGCADQPRQLTADSFYAPPKEAPAKTAAIPQPPPTEPVVREEIVVAPVAAATTSAPTTNVASSQPIDSNDSADTTKPAGPAESGLYMTLGAVVAEVNGTPIYANKIVSLQDKVLAARAREMDPDQFRRFAQGELLRQCRELISDELEFAAAKRVLSADDQKIADMATIAYKQQKITEAGGSLELAKRKARSEDADFDEQVRDQYRKIMRDIFYQRRIFPRVQVTADDMREFYTANFDKLYSQRDQAQFRVIKIDPTRIGGPDSRKTAMQKANFIREKAQRGDDFAALASTENDDDYLKTRGGDPGGWMQRDSYRIDAVDKAVWKLEPGQVSPIIENDGAFYVAKLEAKKAGNVRPFEDPTVQDDIRNRISQQQFVFLRDKYQRELIVDAVVTPQSEIEKRLSYAVDLAMQKYAQWTAKK